jgi:hypothetical protein
METTATPPNKESTTQKTGWVHTGFCGKVDANPGSGQRSFCNVSFSDPAAAEPHTNREETRATTRRDGNWTYPATCNPKPGWVQSA